MGRFSRSLRNVTLAALLGAGFAAAQSPIYVSDAALPRMGARVSATAPRYVNDTAEPRVPARVSVADPSDARDEQQRDDVDDSLTTYTVFMPQAAAVGRQDVVPPEIRARLVRRNAMSAESAAPSIGGIVNAAGYSSALAEGGIAAIFGTNLSTDVCPAWALPLPTTLCGTTVTLDGINVPAFYVSPDQMSAQLPLGTGARTLSVITAAGTATTSVTLHDHAPGVFVLPDWVAAAQHMNYTFMGPTQPINASDPKDNTVVLYLAGTGRVTNRETPLPGTVTPLPTTLDPTLYQVQRPTVVVNGTPVADTDIQYAGLAPGLIGVTEMNLTLHNPGVNDIVACQQDSVSQTTQCSNPATVFVTDGTPYTYGRITSPGTMSDGEHDLGKITGTENGKPFHVGKGGYYQFNETGTINLVLNGNNVWENYADTFTPVAPKILPQPRYRKFEQIHFGNANLPTQTPLTPSTSLSEGQIVGATTQFQLSPRVVTPRTLSTAYAGYSNIPDIKEIPHIVYPDVKGNYDSTTYFGTWTDVSFFEPMSQQWFYCSGPWTSSCQWQQGVKGPGAPVRIFDLVSFLSTEKGNAQSPACRSTIIGWDTNDIPRKLYLDPTNQPYYAPNINGVYVQVSGTPPSNAVAGTDGVWNAIKDNTGVNGPQYQRITQPPAPGEHAAIFAFANLTGAGGLTWQYDSTGALHGGECAPIASSKTQIVPTWGTLDGLAGVARHEFLGRVTGYGATSDGAVSPFATDNMWTNVNDSARDLDGRKIVDFLGYGIDLSKYAK